MWIQLGFAYVLRIGQQLFQIRPVSKDEIIRFSLPRLTIF